MEPGSLIVCPRCNSEDNRACLRYPIMARHLLPYLYTTYFQRLMMMAATAAYPLLSLSFPSLPPFTYFLHSLNDPTRCRRPTGITEWRHYGFSNRFGLCPCDRLAVGLVAPCATFRWDEPLRTGTSGDDGGYNSPKAQTFCLPRCPCGGRQLTLTRTSVVAST